jgi:hypothetical protein
MGQQMSRRGNALVADGDPRYRMQLNARPLGNGALAGPEVGMGRRKGKGRRKVGRKKRRMRSRIRHRKG